MSASLLREAAAKMRERAEAATAQSGSDWACRAHVGGYVWLEPAHIGMHGYQSTAAHIASWHPAVALAVADWLDEVDIALLARETAVSNCRVAEERGEECGCSMKDCYECGQWHNCSHGQPNAERALAVARAYLGSDQ